MRTPAFRIVVSAIAVAGLLVGCRGRAVPGPDPKVTQASFEKIEIGMSMAEVKAILGNPWKVEQSDGPDDFVTLKKVQVRAIYEWNLGSEVDTKAIQLGFKHGKVAAKSQTGL